MNPTFELIVDNLIHILDGARAAILAQDVLDRDCFAAGLESLRRRGTRRRA